MEETVKILYRGGDGEVIEKKSKFLASLEPVNSEEEALGFIERKRREYRDADHNCYAYVIGASNDLSRCSDDGEPSQTAGKPMLEVLTGEGIHNACAVVTRYFGGTLLGTGGLVRAYSGAVREALRQCASVDRQTGERYRISADYGESERIRRLLDQREIPILGQEYMEKVAFTILVPSGGRAEMEAQVMEAAGGRCGIEFLENIFFAEVNGKLLLL